MLNKGFLLKLFEGFSLNRWNDFIRPIEFTEMDRHALKMMIAYFLGKYEEEQGNIIDWNQLIESGFFDLLKKISLSDIKSPVAKRIKLKNPTAYKELNKWATAQYEVYLDKNLFEKFQNYILDEPINNLTLKILKLAHKYSTKIELEILKKQNLDDRVDPILNKIFNDLTRFKNLASYKFLTQNKNFEELIKIIQYLRYQERWNQSPRVPRTSVLGHSMYVASLTFIISTSLNASQSRIRNNFFTALFHDLMESVTRDIISPVKRATLELPDIIKNIENEIAEEELYPFIDYGLDEIKLFSENEFESRVFIDNKWQTVSTDEIQEKYNDDNYNAIDGEIVKICDELSAFIEAYQSIEYGISSKPLKSAITSISEKYKNKKIANINIGKLYLDF
ncbi:putative hydrolase of HD superfamily [Hypnocyclicus thermotrophus]|uniref:Hydrolase of HD superfamily n=1 Tax=Hypnocyclicus thermotrophus TaxID=1627895 RepID=A0AA46DYT0_9FUSO|nr:YfbR-like 5'-deoxynucleotidase [Hypnocyclicus thermotrophus]TDT70563.1 putative hydrolase of HD superfamily [Hypnocyclicus thermotrophus]